MSKAKKTDNSSNNLSVYTREINRSNGIMSDITFSSILIENRKAVRSDNTSVVENDTKAQSKNGIDFKNDTILVSAKNEVDYAKGIENSKDLNKSFAKMETEHLNRDYQTTLNQYQNAISLDRIARSATESLATSQSSVLQQLTKSNEEIATLEIQEAEAQKNVNQFNTQISALNVQKSNLVSAHNLKISSLNEQISAKRLNLFNFSSKKTAVSTKLSTSRSSLSTANSNITSLKNSLGNIPSEAEGAAEQRAIILNAISEQESSINSINLTINRYEQEIASLNNQITSTNSTIANLEAQRAQEEAAKAATVAKYNELIGTSEAELALAKAQLETLTQSLANAVYIQTGLTLQAASISKMIKEAQTFEKSTTTMVANADTKMEKLDEKRTTANEKLEEKDQEYQIAQLTTKDKENEYKKTEENEKAKQTKKEEKEQNIFLA